MTATQNPHSESGASPPTMKFCKKCNTETERTANGWCVPCRDTLIAARSSSEPETSPETKYCRRCKQQKPLDHFHKDPPRPIKNYRETHPERSKALDARRHKATRDRVYQAYGGYTCACCGETEQSFLSIDHINGGGTEHRKEIGKGGAIYAWLLRNNFPPGLPGPAASDRPVCDPRCSSASTRRGSGW